MQRSDINSNAITGIKGLIDTRNSCSFKFGSGCQTTGFPEMVDDSENLDHNNQKQVNHDKRIKYDRYSNDKSCDVVSLPSVNISNSSSRNCSSSNSRNQYSGNTSTRSNKRLRFEDNNDSNWNYMFDTLIHFGIKHNHCNVPLNHIEVYPCTATVILEECNSSEAKPASESDVTIATNTSTSESPLKGNMSLMNQLRSKTSIANAADNNDKSLKSNPTVSPLEDSNSENSRASINPTEVVVDPNSDPLKKHPGPSSSADPTPNLSLGPIDQKKSVSNPLLGHNETPLDSRRTPLGATENSSESKGIPLGVWLHEQRELQQSGLLHTRRLEKLQVG